METIFGVHHDTASLREKNNRLRRNKSQEALSTKSISNATDAIKSQSKARPATAPIQPASGGGDLKTQNYGFHSLLSGRFLASPTITPHGSPPNSRPVTPSADSAEDILRFSNHATSGRPFVSAMGCLLYPLDPTAYSNADPNLSPKLCPLTHPLARSRSHDPVFLQNMKRALPSVSNGLDGDLINRPSSPWSLPPRVDNPTSTASLSDNTNSLTK